MRLALSEISTVGASFEEDVAAYAAAGFDAIGIWEMKLPEDEASNIGLLREAGLSVANCIPAVPSILPLLLPGMEGPPDVAERVDAIRASVHRLAAYEPESILVITGPVGDLDPADAHLLVVEGLREIASAARDAGVRLGLEPIHPGQDDTVSFVHTVADALAVLDEAGLDDVGVMVDTYNLWHEDPAAIAAAAGRVTGLHVADEPTEPGRTDRVLPGESGAHTADVVRALVAAGWDGSLDVEIFSTPDRFWGLPLDEAARRAHSAAHALLP
ncbi:MAG: sugar phosphate isomerase/epimerase family protein [Gaiellaceae bacterium]